MNRGLRVLIIAVLAGAGAYYATRWQHTATEHQPSSGIALDFLPGLDWLRTDLQLNSEQLAKVRELHLAYRPKCAEMCRRIAAAHEKLETLAAANRQITPEYRVALQEHSSIHLECQEAMLQHLYETAATLSETQAARYLNTMLPFALDFTHSESGTLHGP